MIFIIRNNNPINITNYGIGQRPKLTHPTPCTGEIIPQTRARTAPAATANNFIATSLDLRSDFWSFSVKTDLRNEITELKLRQKEMQETVKTLLRKVPCVETHHR